MKLSLRNFLVLAVFLFAHSFSPLHAQVSSYIFGQSSSTYTEITGGTVLGTATDNAIGAPSVDDFVYNLPAASFPFPFTFNGNAYTGCNVNSNGYLTFGATAPAVDLYNPISGTTGYAGAVSAWGRDINTVFNISGATGELRWQVVGTSPNREVVFQWKNFRAVYSNSTTLAYAQSFQIRLQENGNRVVIVYGSRAYLAGVSTISSSVQIGLRGAANTDFNNRTNGTGVLFIASTTGATNTLTQSFNTVNATPGMPTLGLTYIWAPPSGCTGKPTAGITQSSIPDSVCSNSSFTLSLLNQTLAPNLTYQWISSTNGVNYANTSGTSSTFVPSLSASTYYRCIVTCPTGGLSDTSTVLFLKLKTFLNCYCGAPLSGTVNTVDIITKVVLINAVNDSLVQTSASNGVNNHEIYNNTPLNIQGGTSNTLKITYGTDGTQFGAAWIDFNQNGVFDAAENIALSSTSVAGGSTATFTFLAPVGNIGLTRLRVRGGADAAYSAGGACANTSFGETEDYYVNLTAALPCNNPPVAGTIASSKASVCLGDSATITATSFNAFSFLQWQISTDSLAWTNIAGAINPTLNTSAITAVRYYRLKVTCTDSVFTNAVSIKLNALATCYCLPSANDCTDDDLILNVTVNNINNTSSCSVNGYSLYTSIIDTFFKGEDYPISVTVGSGGTEYVGVWIDYNQNGLFETSEYTDLGSGSGTTLFGTLSFPMGAVTGNTRMRVRVRWSTALTNSSACATYTFGETEDYSIYIQVPPPCTTTTVGGTISGDSLGEANNFGLYVLTGFTGNPAWEIAASPNGPFTALNVANDSLRLFLNAVGDFYLRAKVSKPGCVVAYSDTFAIRIFQLGDEPCDAIALNFGANGPYTMEFATASTREVRPLGGDCESQNTWCNTTVRNSLWFKFTAPASGRVRLNAPGFDTRLALWEADTCANLADSTLGNYRLLAANDDDPNASTNNAASFSPLIDTVSCLVPGKTYYVQLAPYDEFDFDTTSLFLLDAGIVDASFTGFSGSAYCLSASNETLTPAVAGGVFTGAGLESVNEFNPALAGIGGPYVISHTLLGCYTFTDTITVTGNPSLDSVSQTNVACFGDSTGALTVYFSIGTPPFSYQWNNGKTTQTITNLVAGTYKVTVTSNDGCPGFSPTYTITQATTALSATLVDTDIKCFGETANANVTVSGGTPTYGYSWSNTVSTTSSVTALGAGAFSVTINDANSCSVVLSDTVKTPASAITVFTVATDVNCNGATTGSVVANVSGGAPNYTYTWSNNTSTTNSITAVGAGIYRVTITDANSCSIVVSDTVNQASAISVSSVAMPQNGSTNGSITVTVSGGTPSYVYAWDNNSITKDITAVAGVYTLTITDANNCTFVLKDTIDFISGIGNANNGIRKVSLYPNPTSGIAVLSIETDGVQNVLVEVYDATGRLLSSIEKASVQVESIPLNLSEYSVGFYTVRVRLNDAVITKQIVLQR